jgi:WD40 repeat protein/energy-coupling factor transporter ATP-binding protein EcfA2
MKSKTPAISPFKFLDSYMPEDKDIFFGREREISEIHTKIYQSKLLLVYGASGTGKSSIINCGLANQLADTDWLPVSVRRSGDISSSMLRQLSKHTAANLELSEDNSQEAYHSNLHKVVSNVFLDHFKPIYLIFDQFEELFIFGYKEEWLKFIHAVRYLMDTDLDVHFMFVIRGEYLEFLSEFEEIIPEFFDNRVRIEKMTRSMARKSITGPSRLFYINLDDDFEENLLKKLSPDKSQIELTFLQVILDKIYRSAKARTNKGENLSFTNEDIEEVGQIGDILAEFVDEQIFKMPDSKAALTILKGFVSLEGTKTQKNLDEIVLYCDNIGQAQNKDTAEAIITSFVNKRILKDKDDNGRYELRHDSLALKIFEKITNQEKELLEVRRFINYNFAEYEKRGSILSDDDLSYVAPYERLLKLDNAQKEFLENSKKRSTKRRRAQRRQTIIIAVIFILMVTSAIGFILSQQQKKRAENMAQIAENESSRAKAAQSSAEEQRQLAAMNAQEAQRQAKIAERQAAEAMRARDLAAEQELEAIRQRNSAERRKAEAQEARVLALYNEKQAIEQKANAEAGRLEAEKLRMLALSREIAMKSIYMVDKERKALLSQVAYELNTEFGGNHFAPNVYRSLYLANKSLNDGNFNSFSLPNKEAIGLIRTNQDQFIATSDGQIHKLNWQQNDLNTSVILNSGLRISSLDLLSHSGYIAAGSRDGRLIIINKSGMVLLKFSLNEQTPVSKTVSMADQMVLIAQNSGSLTVIDAAGKIIRKKELNSKINDLIALNEDTYITALQNGSIVLLNIDLEIIKHVKLSNTGIDKIIKLKNADELVIANDNGEIIKYTTTLGEVMANLVGHTASITDMEISDSGDYLITSSFDRSVRLWNLNDFKSRSILLSEHDRWATSVSIDPDDHYAFSTSYGGKVRKYPLKTSELSAGVCSKMKRSLTKDEWSEFIGEAVPFKEICK